MCPIGTTEPRRTGSHVPNRFKPTKSVALALLRLADADAVPALGGNIRGATEGQPDRPGVLTGGQRLVGRATADLFENEIAPEHGSVRLTELVGNGQLELAQSHDTTLNEETPRRCRRGVS